MPVQIVSEDLSQSISTRDILCAEKGLIQENPYRLIAGEFLKIKTKAGELITLKLNSTQRKLFFKILELRRLNKPIRIWVLKYRQGGISTLIEAIIYALASQQPNRNALIMADEADKSDYLFQMSKLYHEQLIISDPHLITPLKKSNAKSLEFDGLHSQIIIETAENIEAARAYTYQFVHLSEVSRFRDLHGVLGGLMQSVPSLANTLVIGETTANGMDDFYKEWVRAKQGRTDWIPLFFAWFEMEEYKLPLQDGKLYSLEGINFGSDASIAQFEKEEQELKQEFSLTDEQLNWRRWAIVNNCNGDIDLFKQEYPATDSEAFSTSGDLFFDKKGLNRQIECKPQAKGELFYSNLKWEFRELNYGRIEVYVKPEAGEQYIIAADASEAVGSDEAAIVVINKRLNETCAVVAGQYAPEELATMAIALGNYYNTALIAPENKGYGYMVCQLVNQNYGNIYKRMITKTGEQKETEELGFNTNSVTRPQMLAQLNDEIKNGATQLKAKILIDECRTFVIKKDKDGKVTKIEAQDGYQDGVVISRCIAGFVRNQFPFIPKDENKDYKVRNRITELHHTPFMPKGR